MVDGAVVLGVPDDLAWTIFIEVKDCDTIGWCRFVLSVDVMLIRSIFFRIDGYDFALLRQFMGLFPALPLTTLLKGYCVYMDISLSEEPEGEEDDEDGKLKTVSAEDDPFDTIIVRLTHMDLGTHVYILNRMPFPLFRILSSHIVF